MGTVIRGPHDNGAESFLLHLTDIENVALNSKTVFTINAHNR